MITDFVGQGRFHPIGNHSFFRKINRRFKSFVGRKRNEKHLRREQLRSNYLAALNIKMN